MSDGIPGGAHPGARRRRVGTAVLLCLLLTLLAGCDLAAQPDPTPVPTPLPTVTPTSVVTFQVAVTPVVPRRRRRATPVPTATRFVVPNGPFIVLHPNTGPPVDHTIVVIGGHLPPSQAVTILWSLTGRLTPLSTTGYTDAHGGMRATLSIPASAPGLYRVQVDVQGVAYASADYRIVSAASLGASILPGANDGTLVVMGKKFVPGFRLVLIAYPTVGGRQPVVLGNVQVNSRGRFTFSHPVDKLDPGQYVLRAWSASSVAAEMAQTFFEIVV